MPILMTYPYPRASNLLYHFLYAIIAFVCVIIPSLSSSIWENTAFACTISFSVSRSNKISYNYTQLFKGCFHYILNIFISLFTGIKRASFDWLILTFFYTCQNLSKISVAWICFKDVTYVSISSWTYIYIYMTQDVCCSPSCSAVIHIN